MENHQRAVGAKAETSDWRACGHSSETVNRSNLCRSSLRVKILLICLLSFGSSQTSWAALRLLKSEPEHFDFADQRALPPTFGSGEFTFELWIKPDASFPVGYTDRGTLNQLSAWSNADPLPYSTGNWWFAGNFLLDGHTRP